MFMLENIREFSPCQLLGTVCFLFAVGHAQINSWWGWVKEFPKLPNIIYVYCAGYRIPCIVSAVCGRWMGGWMCLVNFIPSRGEIENKVLPRTRTHTSNKWVTTETPIMALAIIQSQLSCLVESRAVESLQLLGWTESRDKARFDDRTKTTPHWYEQQFRSAGWG